MLGPSAKAVVRQTNVHARRRLRRPGRKAKFRMHRCIALRLSIVPRAPADLAATPIWCGSLILLRVAGDNLGYPLSKAKRRFAIFDRLLIELSGIERNEAAGFFDVEGRSSLQLGCGRTGGKTIRLRRGIHSGITAARARRNRSPGHARTRCLPRPSPSKGRPPCPR